VSANPGLFASTKRKPVKIEVYTQGVTEPTWSWEYEGGEHLVRVASSNTGGSVLVDFYLDEASKLGAPDQPHQRKMFHNCSVVVTEEELE